MEEDKFESTWPGPVTLSWALVGGGIAVHSFDVHVLYSEPSSTTTTVEQHSHDQTTLNQLAELGVTVGLITVAVVAYKGIRHYVYRRQSKRASSASTWNGSILTN